LENNSELKEHKQLLVEGQEYTYREAFDLYASAANAECDKLNSKIDAKNKKSQDAVDYENSNEARIANDKTDKDKIEYEGKRKSLLIWGILLILIGLALLFIVIGLIPLLIGLWMIFIKRPKLDYEIAGHNKKNFEPEPHVSFTYFPMGTVACSSCGTKTRIETKTKDESCPNCHSEIFVISQMDKNVQVKQLAKT
jgi:DNA-directed RNA polymerase subunit RPC12/RpoP